MVVRTLEIHFFVLRNEFREGYLDLLAGSWSCRGDALSSRSRFEKNRGQRRRIAIEGTDRPDEDF